MTRILATALSLLALAAAAIEPPGSTPGAPAQPEAATEEEPPPAAEPEAAPAEEAAPEDDAAESGEELPPLPADTAPGPSPQRFNPTEKVRADFPVSFPIDI
jgi:hypothetical protein